MMRSARRFALQLRLDAAFISEALRDGCLAASPDAEPSLDPFWPRLEAETPAAAFTFSDIPDANFREPADIIEISKFVGGSKS